MFIEKEEIEKCNIITINRPNDNESSITKNGNDYLELLKNIKNLSKKINIKDVTNTEYVTLFFLDLYFFERNYSFNDGEREAFYKNVNKLYKKLNSRIDLEKIEDINIAKQVKNF